LSEQHGFRKAENIEAALAAELSFYGQVFGFTTLGVPTLELRRVNLRIGDHVRSSHPPDPCPRSCSPPGWRGWPRGACTFTLGDHVRDRHPRCPTCGTDTDAPRPAAGLVRPGRGRRVLRPRRLRRPAPYWTNWTGTRCRGGTETADRSSDTTALLHLFATRLAAPVVFGP